MKLDALYAVLFSTRTGQSCVIPPQESRPDIRTSVIDGAVHLRIDHQETLPITVKEAFEQLKMTEKDSHYCMNPAMPILPELRYVFEGSTIEVVECMNRLQLTTQQKLLCMPKEWPRKLGMLIDNDQVLKLVYELRDEIANSHAYVMHGLAVRIRSKSRNIGKAIKLAHYLARKKTGLVEIIAGSLLSILNDISQEKESIQARVLHMLLMANVGKECKTSILPFIEHAQTPKLAKWAMNFGLFGWFEDKLYAACIARFVNSRWIPALMLKILHFTDKLDCVITVLESRAPMEEWLVKRIAKTCFEDPLFGSHDRLAKTLFMKGYEYDLSNHIRALDSTECVQRMNELLDQRQHHRISWIKHFLTTSHDLSIQIDPWEYTPNCPAWWTIMEWRSLLGLVDDMTDELRLIKEMPLEQRRRELALARHAIDISKLSQMPLMGLALSTHKSIVLKDPARFITEYGLANLLAINPNKHVPFDWNMLHTLDNVAITVMDPNRVLSTTQATLLVKEAFVEDNSDQRLHFQIALSQRLVAKHASLKRQRSCLCLRILEQRQSRTLKRLVKS